LEKAMPPGVPPLALFRTLARDERLFARFAAGNLLDRGHLSLRERELVIDRTTAVCGSEYEWGVHVAFFGERVRLTADERASLVRGAPSDSCWSESERDLLATVDALLARCDLDDTEFATARARYADEALLEIVLLTGFYRTVSMLTNVARLEPEPFAARFERED
jgi:alkylhydroperoxidase family enzyme